MTRPKTIIVNGKTLVWDDEAIDCGTIGHEADGTPIVEVAGSYVDPDTRRPLLPPKRGFTLRLRGRFYW